MADKQVKTRDAQIVKSFKDAGTGARFEKGKKVAIEEGAFANYAAAGLVRDPDAKAPESDAKGKTPAS